MSTHTHLGSSDGGLAVRPLRHRPALDLDQLVHETGGGCSRPDHQRGADPVRVDRGRGERRDGVLVEVSAEEDLRRPVAEIIELAASGLSQRSQITRVDANRRQLGSTHLHCGADALRDVVGVNQQRGGGSEHGQLRSERRRFIALQQHGGVRRRARRGNAVATTCSKVRRGAEAGNVSRTRRRHRSVLVGAAAAHVDERPATRGQHHAGCRRGDRTVVVQDREHERLEDHAFGEPAADGEHRRQRKVELALGVPVDRTSEAIVAKELERRLVGEPGAAQPVEIGGVEGEVVDGLEHAAVPCHHAESPSRRQVPGEHLEHALGIGPMRAQCARHHRQFVPVGEERGAVQRTTVSTRHRAWCGPSSRCARSRTARRCACAPAPR